MSRAALLGAALVALAAPACGAIPWGSGLVTEGTPGASATPNGVVVALDAPAMTVAAARLTGTASAELPDGVLIGGERGLDPDVVAGLQDLVATFDDVAVDIGAFSLEVGAAGVGMAVEVSLPASTLTFHAGGEPLCQVSFEVQQAELAVWISLGKDKLGQVEASVLNDAVLLVEDRYLDVGSCKVALSPELATEASDLVLASLGDAIATALAPKLEAWLPAALGVGLGFEATMAVSGDGLGGGSASVRVAAPSSSTGSFWVVTAEHLVVPYAVSVEAQPHPCVPAVELPEAIGVAVPPVEAASPMAVFVNGEVAVRAFQAMWSSGVMCGDRAGAEAQLPLEELVAVWPALGALEAGTPLRVRVWPGPQPSVSLETEGGVAELVVGAERLRVELLAELDGAAVQLAAMTLDLTLRSAIDADVDGGVWLSPSAVTVDRVVSTEPGLFDLGSSGAAEALAAPLTETLIAARPIWSLPPLPVDRPLTHVRLAGDYLAFEPPADAPAD